MIIHRFSRFVFQSLVVAAVLCPAVLPAHPGHYHPPGETDEFDSFAAGFVHPWSGMDHLLLALAVGWIAVSAGRRNLWIPSLSFLVAMVAGAFAGRGADGGTALEIGLAATLMLAGIALLRSEAPAMIALAASVATAGLVHGFAHGSEAALGMSFGPLTAGLLVSTSLLVFLGGTLGHMASRVPAIRARSAAGCALIAVGGITIFQSL